VNAKAADGCATTLTQYYAKFPDKATKLCHVTAGKSLELAKKDKLL